MTVPPEWLVVVAWVSLGLGGISCLWILADIFLLGHRQHMGIMDVVWPITGLYAGPLRLIGYYKVGRLGTHKKVKAGQEQDETPPNKTKPFWQIGRHWRDALRQRLHIGRHLREWIMHFVTIGLIAGTAGVWIVFVTWGVDYVLALCSALRFNTSRSSPCGISLKAKASSKPSKPTFCRSPPGKSGCTAGWPLPFLSIFGHHSEAMHKTSPVFWFMMQIAMLFGFLTAYPVNWWLIRQGIKEKM